MQDRPVQLTETSYRRQANPDKRSTHPNQQKSKAIRAQSELRSPIPITQNQPENQMSFGNYFGEILEEGGSGGYKEEHKQPKVVKLKHEKNPSGLRFETKKLISREEIKELISEEDKKRFNPNLSSGDSSKRQISFKIKRKMTSEDHDENLGYFEQKEFLTSLISDKDFGKFDMRVGKSEYSLKSKGSEDYGNVSIDQDPELPLQLETQFNKLMNNSQARLEDQESDEELESLQYKKVLDEGKKIVHQIRKSRMKIRMSGQLSSHNDSIGTTSKLVDSKGFNTSIEIVKGLESSPSVDTPTSNLGLNSPFQHESTVKSRVSGAERGLCSDYTVNSIEGLSEMRLGTSPQPSPDVNKFEAEKGLKRQSFKEMIGSVKVEGFQVGNNFHNKSGRQEASENGGSDFFDQGSFLNMRANDSELLDQSAGIIPNNDQAVYGLQMISKNQQILLQHQNPSKPNLTSSHITPSDTQTSLDQFTFSKPTSHVSLKSTSITSDPAHLETLSSIEYPSKPRLDEPGLQGLDLEGENMGFEAGEEYMEMVHDMVHPSDPVWERRRLEEMAHDKTHFSQLLIEQKLAWGGMMEPISEEHTCDLENSVAMQSFNLSFMDNKEEKSKALFPGAVVTPFGHRSNLSDVGFNPSLVSGGARTGSVNLNASRNEHPKRSGKITLSSPKNRIGSASDLNISQEAIESSAILFRNKSLSRGKLRVPRKVSLKVDEESEANNLFMLPAKNSFKLQNRSMYVQLKDFDRDLIIEKKLRFSNIRPNRTPQSNRTTQEESKVDIQNLRSFIKMSDSDQDHKVDKTKSEIRKSKEFKISIQSRDPQKKSRKNSRTLSKDKTGSSGEDFEFSCVDLDETKENNFYNESLRHIPGQPEEKWHSQIHSAGPKQDSGNFPEFQNFSKKRVTKESQPFENFSSKTREKNIKFENFNLEMDKKPKLEIEISPCNLKNNANQKISNQTKNFFIKESKPSREENPLFNISGESYGVHKMTMEKINGKLVHIDDRTAAGIEEFNFPRKMSEITTVEDSKRPSLWVNNQTYQEMRSGKMNASGSKQDNEYDFKAIREDVSSEIQNSAGERKKHGMMMKVSKENLSKSTGGHKEKGDFKLSEGNEKEAGQNMIVSRDFEVVVDESEYSDGKDDSQVNIEEPEKADINDLMNILLKKTDNLPSSKMSELSLGLTESQDLRESWASKGVRNPVDLPTANRVISGEWGESPNPFLQAPKHQVSGHKSVKSQQIMKVEQFGKASSNQFQKSIGPSGNRFEFINIENDDQNPMASGFQEIHEVTYKGVGIKFKQRPKKGSVALGIKKNKINSPSNPPNLELPDSFCKTMDHSYLLPNAFSKRSNVNYQTGSKHSNLNYQIDSQRSHNRKSSTETKKTRRPMMSDIEKSSHHYMTSVSHIESTIDLKGSADFNLESFQEKFGEQSGYNWQGVETQGLANVPIDAMRKPDMGSNVFRSSYRKSKEEQHLRTVSIGGPQLEDTQMAQGVKNRKHSEGTEVKNNIDPSEIIDRRVSGSSNKKRLKGRVVNEALIDDKANQLIQISQRTKEKEKISWGKSIEDTPVNFKRMTSIHRNEDLIPELLNNQNVQEGFTTAQGKQKLVIGSMLSDEEDQAGGNSIDLGSHVSLKVESQQFIEPDDQTYSQTGFESVIGDFGEETTGLWLNDELMMPSVAVEPSPARDFQKKNLDRLGLTEEAKERAVQGMKKYKTSKLAKKIVRMSKKASQKETINIRSLIGTPLTQSRANNIEQMSNNPTKSSLRSKLKRSVVGSTKKSLKDKLRGSGLLRLGSSLESESKLTGTFGSLSVHSNNKSSKPLKKRSLRNKIKRFGALNLSKSNSRDTPKDLRGRRVSDSRKSKFGSSVQVKDTESSERCESLFDKELPMDLRLKNELKRSQTVAYNSKLPSQNHISVQKSESLAREFFPGPQNNLHNLENSLKTKLEPGKIGLEPGKEMSGQMVVRKKSAKDRKIFPKKRSMSEENIPKLENKNKKSSINSAYRNKNQQKTLMSNIDQPIKNAKIAPKKKREQESRAESLQNSNKKEKPESMYLQESKPRPASVDSESSSNLMRRLGTASDSSFFPFPKSVSSKFAKESKRRSKEGSTGGRKVKDNARSASGTDTIGFESGTDRELMNKVMGGRKPGRAQKEEYGMGSISKTTKEAISKRDNWSSNLSYDTTTNSSELKAQELMSLNIEHTRDSQKERTNDSPERLRSEMNIRSFKSKKSLKQKLKVSLKSYNPTQRISHRGHSSRIQKNSNDSRNREGFELTRSFAKKEREEWAGVSQRFQQQLESALDGNMNDKTRRNQSSEQNIDFARARRPINKKNLVRYSLKAGELRGRKKKQQRLGTRGLKTGKSLGKRLKDLNGLQYQPKSRLKTAEFGHAKSKHNRKKKKSQISKRVDLSSDPKEIYYKVKNQRKKSNRIYESKNLKNTSKNSEKPRSQKRTKEEKTGMKNRKHEIGNAAIGVDSRTRNDRLNWSLRSPPKFVLKGKLSQMQKKLKKQRKRSEVIQQDHLGDNEQSGPSGLLEMNDNDRSSIKNKNDLNQKTSGAFGFDEENKGNMEENQFRGGNLRSIGNINQGDNNGNVFNIEEVKIDKVVNTQLITNYIYMGNSFQNGSHDQTQLRPNFVPSQNQDCYNQVFKKYIPRPQNVEVHWEEDLTGELKKSDFKKEIMNVSSKTMRSDVSKRGKQGSGFNQDHVGKRKGIKKNKRKDSKADEQRKHKRKMGHKSKKTKPTIRESMRKLFESDRLESHLDWGRKRKRIQIDIESVDCDSQAKLTKSVLETKVRTPSFLGQSRTQKMKEYRSIQRNKVPKSKKSSTRGSKLKQIGLEPGKTDDVIIWGETFNSKTQDLLGRSEKSFWTSGVDNSKKRSKNAKAKRQRMTGAKTRMGLSQKTEFSKTSFEVSEQDLRQLREMQTDDLSQYMRSMHSATQEPVKSKRVKKPEEIKQDEILRRIKEIKSQKIIEIRKLGQSGKMKELNERYKKIKRKKKSQNYPQKRVMTRGDESKKYDLDSDILNPGSGKVKFSKSFNKGRVMQIKTEPAAKNPFLKTSEKNKQAAKRGILRDTMKSPEPVIGANREKRMSKIKKTSIHQSKKDTIKTMFMEGARNLIGSKDRHCNPEAAEKTPEHTLNNSSKFQGRMSSNLDLSTQDKLRKAVYKRRRLNQSLMEGEIRDVASQVGSKHWGETVIRRPRDSNTSLEMVVQQNSIRFLDKKRALLKKFQPEIQFRYGLGAEDVAVRKGSGFAKNSRVGSRSRKREEIKDDGFEGLKGRNELFKEIGSGLEVKPRMSTGRVVGLEKLKDLQSPQKSRTKDVNSLKRSIKEVRASIKTLKERAYKPLSKIKMEHDILGSKRRHKFNPKKHTLSQKLEKLQFSKKKLSSKTQIAKSNKIKSDKFSPSLQQSVASDISSRAKIFSVQSKLDLKELRKKTDKLRKPAVFIKTGFWTRNQKSKKKKQIRSRVLTSGSQNEISQIKSLKDTAEVSKWKAVGPDFSFEDGGTTTFKATPSISSFKTEGSQNGADFNIYCRRDEFEQGKNSESGSQGEVIYRRSIISQKSDKGVDRVFGFKSVKGGRKKIGKTGRLVDLKKLLKKQKKGKKWGKTGYLSQNTPS